MKNLPYRDHAIYLVMASVFAFSGAMFTGNVVSYNSFILESKLLSAAFLMINTFLIYGLITFFYEKRTLSLCISFLYLFAPTHFDIFIYQFQFQTLISETLFLVFLSALLLERTWESVGFFILSAILNSKMLVLSLFIFASKKFSHIQKVITCLVSVIIFIFVSPLFLQNTLSVGDALKSIMFISENLINPFSFKILNFSLVYPGYYNKFQVILIATALIAIIVAAIKSNNYKTRGLLSLIVFSFLQAMLPLKQVLPTESYFYYYLPSLQPFVLLVFLFVLAHFLSKYERFKKIQVICISILSILWLTANLIYQSNFQNIANEWSYTIHLLPKSFDHEKEIKLAYAGQLINNGLDDEAAKIIDENKQKFPDLKWYTLLLGIAVRENDSDKAEAVYDQLRRSQIPFESEE